MTEKKLFFGLLFCFAFFLFSQGNASLLTPVKQKLPNQLPSQSTVLNSSSSSTSVANKSDLNIDYKSIKDLFYSNEKVLNLNIKFNEKNINFICFAFSPFSENAVIGLNGSQQKIPIKSVISLDRLKHYQCHHGQDLGYLGLNGISKDQISLTGFINIGDQTYRSFNKNVSEKNGVSLAFIAPDFEWVQPESKACGVEGIIDKMSDENSSVDHGTPERRRAVTNEDLEALPDASPWDHFSNIALLAIETDYELFFNLTNSNDPAPLRRAEFIAFVSQFIASASVVMLDELNVSIVINYLGIYDSPDDPWSDTYKGKSILEEFADCWKDASNGLTDIDRAAAHFLTGRRMSDVGGVARLDSLCDDNRGYGLSGISVDGRVMPAPGELLEVRYEYLYDDDLKTFLHELGHQFGSNHTRCYSPSIDRCGHEDDEGGCYPDEYDPVGTTGTLMSYCSYKHLSYGDRVGRRIQKSIRKADCLISNRNSPPVLVESNINFDPLGPNHRDFLLSGYSAIVDLVVSDPEGDPIYYEWLDDTVLREFFLNGSPVNGRVQRSVSFDHLGRYEITLMLYDQWGAFSKNIIPINVELPAPVIEEMRWPHINERQQGVLLKMVVHYYHPTRHGLILNWNFGDGTPVQRQVIEAGQQGILWQMVKHTYVREGRYIASVTIDDGINQVRSEEEIEITNNRPSIASITVPVSGNDRTAGRQTRLRALINERDYGQSTRVSWNFGDGSPNRGDILFSNNSSRMDRVAEVEHRYAVRGNYTVTLNVEDEYGGRDSKQVLVNIVAGVPILDAVEFPKTASPGVPVHFRAVGIDPDNETLNFIWYFGDDPIPVIMRNISADEAARGVEVEHVYFDRGYYPVSVELYDSSGNRGGRYEMTIKVLDVPSVNWPPIIDRLTFTGIPEVGQPLRLLVEAHDPNHDELVYDWSLSDGVVSFTGSDPFLSHIFPEDPIEYTVTVTDDEGLSASASRLLTEADLDEGLNNAVSDSVDGVSFPLPDNNGF
ncbi:MAG: YD repeat-containing protein [uncultured bacterium]|nr:MAG: YD repeat-containing protein [uncultured bacterium]